MTTTDVTTPGRNGAAPPVAIVPTAPLLLPALSPQQPAHLVAPVADLRAAVARTLAGVLTGDVVVALAVGDELGTVPPPGADGTASPDDASGGVHRGGVVDRTTSGHPQLHLDVPGDDDLAAAVAASCGLPLRDGEVVAGDLGVLVALLVAARPDVRVVPVALPALTTSDAAADVAAALRAALAGRRWSLVVAGDLAATRETVSPGYVVDGAVAFDDAVVAALRAGDADGLAALGVAEADRVQARGYLPVTVAARCVDGPFAEVALVAPRGVGLLVAASVATGTDLPDAPAAVLADA